MFHVIAGKYDGQEENIKYAANFADLSDALREDQENSDYHFHRIEYTDPRTNKTYIINLDEINT